MRRLILAPTGIALGVACVPNGTGTLLLDQIFQLRQISLRFPAHHLGFLGRLGLLGVGRLGLMLAHIVVARQHGAISATCLDDTLEDKAETVGVVLPQIELRVIDPVSGDVVPAGTLGELCIRGFSVMNGYYDMPGATASAIDVDGWLHTGDLGTMDERGYCKIQGRLKDMIIRGGENICPREIEAVLYQHPAVSDVAVVGVPDERWGEQVTAFVRLADGAGATPDELSAHVRDRLAAYKAPRSWVFVNAFPLTGSGKIQKFVLREQCVKGELKPS